MKTILIVDDEPAARYGLRKALEAKYRIAEADSAEAAREALTREQPDLLLLDVVLPGQDGLSFLKWMREQGSELPVLMVSALDTAKTAVQALQLGAADYLVKGFELDELRQRVDNLVKLSTLEKENDALRRRMAADGQFGQMIGRSAEMRRAFEMADRVAPTDSTVLILGESGTGKDLLAQEIHARSPRAGKPYVAVNCAALPETLIDSKWKISRRLVLPAARGNPRAASLARAQGRHGPAGRDLSPNARRKGGANPTPEPQGAGRHREIRLAGQCARIEECLGARRSALPRGRNWRRGFAGGGGAGRSNPSETRRRPGG